MKTNYILNLSLSIALFCLLTIPSSLLAGPSPEKVRDIIKLLEVSGIQEQLNYMKENLTQSFASAIRFTYPEAPDAFWTEFSYIVSDHEMDELVARVVPVYDKHMDHKSVKKLIAMFENPFWAAWKKKMPLISREAGIIGAKWSHDMMESKGIKSKVDTLIKKHNLGQLKKPEPSQKSSENR